MINNLTKIYFKTDFVNSLNKYASSQIFSNFLRLVSGFLVIRFIEPELYGQFTGMNIYLGYLILLNVGSINGLGREFPFEFGRKNIIYAKKLANSVFSYCLIISVIIFIIFIILTMISLYNTSNIVTLFYFSYAIIGPLTLMNKHFLPVLYKTNDDFNSLSNQNIKLGYVNLFTVFLVYFFNVYGLILRACLIAIFEFYLLYKNKPYKLYYKFNFTDVKKMIKTGFPIFSIGNINPLWENILNNFILILGGPLQFGLFALSSMLMSVFSVIPSSFSQVIYPKMSMMFGQEKPIKEILKFSIKPLFLLFFIMLFLTFLIYYLLPIFIPFLLPKYIDGIAAARWIVFIPLVLSFNSLLNIYNVIKKQKYLFIAYILGAFVGSSYIYYQILNDKFSLIYFSQGLLISFLIQQILGFIFIKKIIND